MRYREKVPQHNIMQAIHNKLIAKVLMKEGKDILKKTQNHKPSRQKVMNLTTLKLKMSER